MRKALFQRLPRSLLVQCLPDRYAVAEREMCGPCRAFWEHFGLRQAPTRCLGRYIRDHLVMSLSQLSAPAGIAKKTEISNVFASFSQAADCAKEESVVSPMW